MDGRSWVARGVGELVAIKPRRPRGGHRDAGEGNKRTGMRSEYFWRMRSASALRFSKGCSSLNLLLMFAVLGGGAVEEGGDAGGCEGCLHEEQRGQDVSGELLSRGMNGRICEGKG